MHQIINARLTIFFTVPTKFKNQQTMSRQICNGNETRLSASTKLTQHELYL